MHTGGAPWLATALGAGLGWAFALHLAVAPSPSMQALMALGCLLALAVVVHGVFRPSKGRRVWHLLCWATLAFCLTFFTTLWRAQHRLAEQLSPQLVGRDIQLDAHVVSMPARWSEGQSFMVSVQAARLDGRALRVGDEVPRTIRLAAFQAWREGEAQSTEMPVHAGERWRWTVRLQLPHGVQNPGGFDAELWMFEQGIRATGGVRGEGQRLAASEGVWIERGRESIRDALLLRIADPKAAGVLAALVVGDQASIDPEDWRSFRLTGVSHLMAISGLHITMLAWLATRVVQRLWRRWPRGVRALPAVSLARWAGLAVAVLYALLAGWGVPAQRTVLMLALVTVVLARGLAWPAWQTLGLAAMVVLMVDPWAATQAGFCLSFGAVGLLMLRPKSEPEPHEKGSALGHKHKPRWRALRRQAIDAVRTQWAISLGLAPLTLVLFQQVSLAGLLANLVAIPWITLLVTPLALLGVLLPWAWDGAAWALSLLSQGLTPMAQWSWASWSAAKAAWWAQLLGLIGAVGVMVRFPLWMRGLSMGLMLPLLWPALDRPPPGDFDVLALDVGQGTSVIVRSTHHTLVYDTGPQTSPRSDAGSRVVVPALRVGGDHVLDALVLSHRDIDHVGGATSLLRDVPARILLTSLEPGHPLRVVHPGHQTCEAGQSWTWDGVRFEVLFPGLRDAERAAAGHLPPNAVSCVLRVQGERGSLLLTGDVGLAQELTLLTEYGSKLASTVMLMPHHGSLSSSGPDFIDAVAPKVAVVQSAYRNRFAHPVPSVVQRYVERGVKVVSSPSCGAWTWRSSEPPKADAGAHCWRYQQGRLWHTGSSLIDQTSLRAKP